MSSRTQRWMIVTPNVSKGAFANITRSLTNGLSRRGVDLSVVYLSQNGDPIGFPSSVDLLALSGRARRVAGQISRYLVQWQPDVVVSLMFMVNVPTLLGAVLARYRGLVLVTESSLPTPDGIEDYPTSIPRVLISPIYNALYMRADSIVCVSGPVRDAIRERLRFERLRQRLAVIPNPVALNGSSSASLGYVGVSGGAEPLFVTVGRLVPRKRMDLVVEAFSEFVNDNGLGHLVVLGDGPEKEALSSMIAGLGLGGRVRLAGFISTPGELISQATCLLHLASAEAFGLAVVESMALGTPVIVARGSGGPSELVGSGGIVVDPDPWSVSAAMTRVWSDRSLADDLRRGGLIVARQFSPEAIAEQWLGLAGSLLKRRA